MIQRLIGVSVGALVTFLLLLLFDGGQRIVSDANQGYLWASIIGAIASFFWPIVITWFLVRRRKTRRDDQVQAEVERQLAEQQNPK